ncbi:hypothetical protein niasHT_009078 [Heterodera trifolii]|uniref:Uncharacterized protein n=1 Tax=Heterodera trifolii TaxID=157864 RepID=A0ABD2MAH3_9BILA
MQTINNRRNAAQATSFWRPFCKVYADNNGKISEEFNDEAQESADVPQLRNAAEPPKIIAAATKAILVPVSTFFVHQTQSKRAMASECGGGECQNCDNIGKFENKISMVKSKGQNIIIRTAEEEEEKEEKRKSEEEEEEQQQQEEEEEEEESDGPKKGGLWEKHHGNGAMGGGSCGANGGKQCPRRCCCCCGCAKECGGSEKGADKSILGPIDSQQSAQKKVPLQLFKPFFARNANFGVFNSPPKLIDVNDKVAEKQRSSVDESLENLKERLGKISNKLDFWKTNLLRKPLQAIDESIPTAADQQQKETNRADQLKMLKEVISKELAAITVTEKLTKTLLDNGDENAKDGDGRNSTSTAQTVAEISNISSTSSSSSTSTWTTTTTISTTTPTATVTSSNSTEETPQQQKQQMPMEIIKPSAPAFSSSSATTLSTTPTAEEETTKTTTTEMPSQNGTKSGTTAGQQIDQIVTLSPQLIQTTTTISDFDNTTSSTSTPTIAVNGTLFTLTTRQLQTASAGELPTPPPYVPANEPSNMPIVNALPVITQEMAPTDSATGNNGTAQPTTLISLTPMDQSRQNGNDKANALTSPATTPVTIMKPVPQIVVSSNEKTMAEQNAYTDHLTPILPNLDSQNITKPFEEEKENGTKERMNRMQFDENNLGQIYNVKMEDPQIAVNGRPISLVSSNFASKNVKESEHKNSEFREYPHRKKLLSTRHIKVMQQQQPPLSKMLLNKTAKSALPPLFGIIPN